MISTKQARRRERSPPTLCVPWPRSQVVVDTRNLPGPIGEPDLVQPRHPLQRLNRREEALAAELEATDLRRALVTDNPAAFIPDLARCLLLLEALGGQHQAEGVLSTFDGQTRNEIELAVERLRL